VVPCARARKLPRTGSRSGEPYHTIQLQLQLAGTQHTQHATHSHARIAQCVKTCARHMPIINRAIDPRGCRERRIAARQVPQRQTPTVGNSESLAVATRHSSALLPWHLLTYRAFVPNNQRPSARTRIKLAQSHRTRHEAISLTAPTALARGDFPKSP
jgi:hypothetical protein